MIHIVLFLKDNRVFFPTFECSERVWQTADPYDSWVTKEVMFQLSQRQPCKEMNWHSNISLKN